MAMGANVGALLCCLAALQNSQNSVQTGCTFPLRDGAPLSLIARKNGRMQRTAMAGAHGTISQARSSKGPERPNTHSQQAIQPRPWRTHQLLTGCLVDGELSSFRDTVTFLKRCASRVSEQQGHRAVVGSRKGQSPEAAKKPDLDFAAAAAAAAAIRCQSWGL
ncbi:uncharacterized protein VDAG_06554 [Verticillium dahliae VdLs.17]|uniref:Secreted protein n=1 Tax=Verticillium dahliae (strain VdLs.17 / ATCC MYA-4575 / FGSC 10137) TaxID=498257 RepID=G2X7U6_VERDV|nr:uncharacterized protein VDAG_06554 [Verticillium dahliae VdLs.17]EGY15064.1 hypothetical protein VDAG_06554 [Verticillium dahliae VdLs.17]KAH6694471.1 hypothetical protein EV126DRAFT_444322 [Verticillium dahliae]